LGCGLVVIRGAWHFWGGVLGESGGFGYIWQLCRVVSDADFLCSKVRVLLCLGEFDSVILSGFRPTLSFSRKDDGGLPFLLYFGWAMVQVFNSVFREWICDYLAGLGVILTSTTLNKVIFL